MSYTVLARRYRSRSFDELVGQESIARTLKNAIASDRAAHAYLFCGTRGVGKTSLARIFAKALNVSDDLEEAEAIGEAILRGDDLDVIEIDGASNRGINEARDLIAGSGLSPARCRHKIYIIDEVHMLTKEAFNALLKTMEEPPAHVKFILCTTDPAKVPATIQSRCQRFDFRAIPTPLIAKQLRHIVTTEGLAAEDAVLQEVARMGRGSMRDALSLLDRLLAAGGDELTLETAKRVLGLPDHRLVDAIVDAITGQSPAEVLPAGAALLAHGATVEQALELLAEHFRVLMVVVACGADSGLLDLPSDVVENAGRQASHFDVAGLVHMIALCDASARAARNSATSRAVFDAALVRMCLAEQLADLDAVLAGGPPPMPQKKSRDDARARVREVELKPKQPKPPAVARTTPPAAAASVAPVATVAAIRAAVPATPPPKEAPAEPPPAGPPDGDPPDGATLWRSVVETAAAAPKDAALVGLLRYDAFDGRHLRLRVDDAGGAPGRFLARRTEAIADLVLRATGRRVEIEVAPQSRATERVESATREEVHRLPAVRRAMDLFGAVVTEAVKVPVAGEGQ